MMHKRAYPIGGVRASPLLREIAAGKVVDSKISLVKSLETISTFEICGAWR
jgi:hypothetical protein